MGIDIVANADRRHRLILDFLVHFLVMLKSGILNSLWWEGCIVDSGRVANLLQSVNHLISNFFSKFTNFVLC